jgi:hypothetical protein
MNYLINLFNEHPNDVGETYFQHMRMALKFSFNCAWASVTLFIHSFFPFLFPTTGSRTITHLFQTMVKQRMKKHEQECQAKTNHDSELVADDEVAGDD